MEYAVQRQRVLAAYGKLDQFIRARHGAAGFWFALTKNCQSSSLPVMIPRGYHGRPGATAGAAMARLWLLWPA